MDIFWQHVLQIFEYMLLSNKFQTNSEPGGLHTKQVQDFNKKNLSNLEKLLILKWFWQHLQIKKCPVHLSNSYIYRTWAYDT